MLGVIRERLLDPDNLKGDGVKSALKILKCDEGDLLSGEEEGNVPVCVEWKITVKKFMELKRTI